MRQIKVFFLYAIATLVMAIANFSIYNLSFISQATPYLTEEQRLDGAVLMLQTTIPAYLLLSAFICLLIYLFNRRRSSSDS